MKKMKKIILISLLFLLFVACEKDDEAISFEEQRLQNADLICSSIENRNLGMILDFDLESDGSGNIDITNFYPTTSTELGELKLQQARLFFVEYLESYYFMYADIGRPQFRYMYELGQEMDANNIHSLSGISDSQKKEFKNKAQFSLNKNTMFLKGDFAPIFGSVYGDNLELKCRLNL